MPPDTPARRKNQRVPATKMRTVRVDDELWQAAQEVAKAQRETVADVLRRALLAYVKAAGREV